MKSLIFCFFSLGLSAFASSEISVMTFNVENLFDTEHDLGREDYTYLPLKRKKDLAVQKFCQTQKGFYKSECLHLDWNDTLVKKKLENVARVILSVNKGRGPDLLFLVEVENKKILNILNQKYLKKSNYSTVILIEGPDKRGIDVALLSRLPSTRSQLHLIPELHTRGVLEVQLRTPAGPDLTAFVAHFPSQRNPRGWRKIAVDFMLRKLTEKKTELFVFGGDLNISKKEERETGFYAKTFSQVGLVAHQMGCHNCEGTHFFRKEWSFLDTLIFAKSMASQGTGAYQLDASSIKVIKAFNHQSPQRFDTKTGLGVSDHFPLFAKIKVREKKPTTSPRAPH